MIITPQHKNIIKQSSYLNKHISKYISFSPIAICIQRLESNVKRVVKRSIKELISNGIRENDL